MAAEVAQDPLPRLVDILGSKCHHGVEWSLVESGAEFLLAELTTRCSVVLKGHLDSLAAALDERPALGEAFIESRIVEPLLDAACTPRTLAGERPLARHLPLTPTVSD